MPEVHAKHPVGGRTKFIKKLEGTHSRSVGLASSPEEQQQLEEELSSMLMKDAIIQLHPQCQTEGFSQPFS